MNRTAKRYLPYLLVVVCYAALLVGSGFLKQPIARDELEFWPVSLAYSESWLPSPQLMRDPDAPLNTPLPFILFGTVEHLFHGGIAAARAVNLLLSLAMALWIAKGDGRTWRGLLCTVGLLLCPYYLGTSILLYTDLVAAFCGLSGLVLHRRGQRWLAAGCWVAAIASRQYLLAVPLAVGAWELWLHRSEGLRIRSAWVAPLLASATIFGWYALYGGFAPAGTLARERVATAAFWAVAPEHSLYYLTTIGVYYVLPALLLLGLWPRLARRVRASRWIVLGSAAALALAFALAPPLHNHNPGFVDTMGYFDKAARVVLSDGPRAVLYYVLALAAIVALLDSPLALLLLGTNSAALLKSQVAWDKYALPLLVLLWYLASRDSHEGWSDRAEPPGQRAEMAAPSVTRPGRAGHVAT